MLKPRPVKRFLLTGRENETENGKYAVFYPAHLCSKLCLWRFCRLAWGGLSGKTISPKIRTKLWELTPECERLLGVRKSNMLDLFSNSTFLLLFLSWLGEGGIGENAFSENEDRWWARW